MRYDRGSAVEKGRGGETSADEGEVGGGVAAVDEGEVGGDLAAVDEGEVGSDGEMTHSLVTPLPSLLPKMVYFVLLTLESEPPRKRAGSPIPFPSQRS